MNEDCEAHDLNCLQDAVNDSARAVSILWSSFTLFGFYLAISTGSVTHRDLFLDNPVKLPLLSVELPVDGFFVVAPLVYIAFQAYLLLSLVRMVGKLSAWQTELRQAVPLAADQRLVTMRLTDFPFLQFLAERSYETFYLLKLSLIAISWLTLTLFPLVILLFMQLTFLPDHIANITWLHRFAIVVEFALAWGFWIAIHWRERAGAIELTLFVPGALLTFGILAFSVFFATFPGERNDKNWLKYGVNWTLSRFVRDANGAPAKDPVSTWLFDGTIDEGTGRYSSLFADRIILPNARFYDDDKHKNGEPSISLRGRDLKGAILQNADLRYADFRGADLSGAYFVRALLDGALFDCPSTIEVKRGDGLPLRRPRRSATDPNDAEDDSAASMLEDRRAIPTEDEIIQSKRAGVCTKLDNANFSGAQAPNASFEQVHLLKTNFLGTVLTGADFAGATFNGADFSGAQASGASFANAGFRQVKFLGAVLQGASFAGAIFTSVDLKDANLQDAILTDTALQGVTFDSVALDGAHFDRAKLQGAVFSKAVMRGASLNAAQLRGATLDSALLSGASFEEADLEGASLESATLTGAVFKHAQAQGAQFHLAIATGATFVGAQLQGANFQGATLDYARFDNANLYRATLGAVNAQIYFRSIAISTDFPRLLSEGADTHNESRPLDSADGYKNLLSRAVAGVTSPPTVSAIMRRLRVLDPEQKADNGDAGHADWQAVIPTKPALRAKLQSQRLSALTDAMCALSGAPFVARGMIANGALDGDEKNMAPLIAMLRDPAKCPAAKFLSDSDLTALDALEAKIAQRAATP